MALLVGLLSHENADIVIDAVEVIHELTDEEVGNEGDDEDENEQQAREAALKALIDGLVCDATGRRLHAANTNVSY